MTEQLPARGDALEAEFNQQPEQDTSGRGNLEAVERIKTNDAASAEFSIQPEHSSISSPRPHSSSIPPQEHEKSGPSTWESALDVAAHWSWITIFSILGTLTRLGIQSLNNYTGHLIPPLVWAQFIGCAVIGFVTQDTHLFPKKSPKNDALFLGITVGYCGSVTSFSAWILQVFEDLANTEGYARSRGYNVISIVTQVMVTLAASLAAFRLGNHIAILTNTKCHFPTIARLSSPAWIVVLVIIAIACQVGTIVTSGVRREWRGIVAFAMVFSPAGALTRWYLSRTMNRLVPAFPMGTFTANMVGSLLESIFHLLQYRVNNGNACALLQGLQDGYCGTLTTVSTFIVELCALQKSHAYIYASTSIILGIILYVLIDGIDFWVHGLANSYFPICTY